jgi:hypothetical protein
VSCELGSKRLFTFRHSAWVVFDDPVFGRPSSLVTFWPKRKEVLTFYGVAIRRATMKESVRCNVVAAFTPRGPFHFKIFADASDEV